MKRFRSIISIFLLIALVFVWVPVQTRAAKSGVLGDLDGSGSVDFFDGMYALQYYAGLVDESEIDASAADADGNGSVDFFDGMYILQFYAGVIEKLPGDTTPEATDITLKVWSSYADQENDSGWITRMEEAFEEAHPEYNITWVNTPCSVGDAVTQITAENAVVPDVYLYANDQLGTLVEAGALTKLEGEYLDQVRNDVSDAYQDTVTHTDGGIYGFPYTCNTWFMYYNKSILSEEDVKSMEACLEKGIVAMELNNSWYLPAFFFAAGGTMFGENGNDASAGIQFGGEVGVNATNAVLDLLAHPNFRVDGEGFGVSGLRNGTVAAYFSGSWDYTFLCEALGENLGAAPAPTVTIDGETRQLRPYAGSKAVGVHPDAENHDVAMEFAAFLASEEAQLAHFQLRSVTPAISSLADNPEVTSSITAAAEIATMKYAIVQPIIPEMNAVWGPMGTFGYNLADGAIIRENVTEMVDALYYQLNPGEVPEEKPTEPAEPTAVTLKVWAPQEDQADDNSWLIQMQEAFEKDHPEYDITWDNGVYSAYDVGVATSSDPAAAADVYMYDNEYLDDLVQVGVLTKLEGEYLAQVKNDVSVTYQNAVTHTDDGIYGFPMNSSTWFMYYNKSILSEEDVKSLEACLEKGIVAFEVRNSWYLPAFFFAAGGTLFGEKGNDASAGVQFGGEAGLAATEKLLELLAHPNFKVDGDGYGNFGLKDGTVAAYFSGSWEYAGLYEALGENLGAVAAPTININGKDTRLQPYGRTHAVGVNPNADNHEAAMEFASFLASAESQLIRYQLRGITPAVSDLATNPEVAASVVATVEMEAMEYAYVQPGIPEMNNVWGPIGTFGQNLVNGTITYENAPEMVDALYAQLNP